MSSFMRRLFYAIAYLGNPPWDTGISPPELLAFLQSHPPGRALDLGCGSGTNLLTLVQHGWDATGVDFSDRAVRLARQRLLESGSQAQAIKGDVTQPLPVEGKFQLILDIGCYHDLDTDGKTGYRRNVRERLMPDGTLLIYAHWFTSDHPKGTGVEENDIQAFAEFLTPEEINHTTDRWDRHTVWMRFTNPQKLSG